MTPGGILLNYYTGILFSYFIHKGEINGPLPLLKSLVMEFPASDSAFYYVSRFRRYFTFHIEEDEITKTEFREWLEAPQEAEEDRLNALIRKAQGKRSLNFRFAMAKIGEYDLDSLKRFFAGLFRMWFDSSPRRGHEIKKVILSKFRITENNLVNTDEFFAFVKGFIAQYHSADYLKVGELCKDIRSLDARFENHVREIERENFNGFLHSNEVYPKDILRSDSDLHVLYANSLEWHTEIVGWSDDGGEETERFGSTPLIDILCNYFESNKRPGRQEFIDSFCSYETFGPDGEPYIDYLPEEMASDHIRSIFGTEDNYKRFLNAAFLPSQRVQST